MQSATRDTPEVQRAVRSAILSAIVGTAVEWYDYYLYATAAATLFNKLFFPSYDHLTGTLLAYASFAIGFIVRPAGSVLFGRLGDRIGRKAVLIVTLLLMGGATTLMGLLPTYAHIGVWAPILLCVLRALQGLGSGAEYAGAVLMVVEYAPPKRRGLYGALPYTGVALGLLLSLATFHLSSNLSKAAFEDWGWRIPFLLSAVVVILGLVLRSKLKETPVFEEIRKRNAQVKAPVREVFRTSLRPMLCAWGARLGDNSLAYIYESFVIVYVTQQLHMSRDVIVSALMFSTAMQFITVPFFGWVSDKIGRKPVYIGGALISGAAVFPFFAMLGAGHTAWIYAGLFLVSSVAKTMMTSAQSPWLAEMFPSRVRYTGFSLAREVTSPISGGIAPMIAVALLAAGGGSPHLVAWYVVALGVITAISVVLGPETRGRSLDDAGTLDSAPGSEPWHETHRAG
ncbi:MFS transporter [Chitinasiproducens palmae]|uniref:Metabolite-proton symporter n=1 Tax=Chitinasiproducens palmae TaxID=1770053 RepID=A0A1H2PIN2_9BURK|nr:MFS transporter [Chitinasiproducens palmae]SDV46111.1 metabolite-proton symporter [Chitinasiproducens palmae]